MLTKKTGQGTAGVGFRKGVLLPNMGRGLRRGNSSHQKIYDFFPMKIGLPGAFCWRKKPRTKKIGNEKAKIFVKTSSQRQSCKYSENIKIPTL